MEYHTSTACFKRLSGKQNGRLQLFPLWNVLKDYSWKKAKADLHASINVSIMDFPQAMAYAMIAGFPIQFGIYTAAIASVVGPIFSGSRCIMTGPTTATSILVLSTFLALNLDASQVFLALPLLVLMVGLLLVFGAMLRLAGLARYISRSVTIAYVTAIALLIVMNQFGTAIGCKVPRSSTFMEMLQMTCLHLHNFHWPTILTSLITLFVYFFLKKRFPKIPHIGGTLLVMALVTESFNQFGANIQTATAVADGAWDLSLPVWDWELIRFLGQPAIALALLILLDSSNIAKTIAAHAGDRVDLNQQMFSMGLSNIASALGSGMVISSSAMRSQINLSSGAKTIFSSVFSGLILIIGMLLLGQFFNYIPKPSLAVLTIIVAFSLIRWDAIKMIINSTLGDAAVFFITLLMGLVFQLESAIYIGAAISIVFFLKKVGTPQLVEYDFNDSGELLEKVGSQTNVPEISIVHVEGDLFFGSTDIFLDQTSLIIEAPNLKVVILRLRNAHHLDATSIMAINELVQFARDKGRYCIISDILPEIEAVFRSSGLIELIGEENCFAYTAYNPNWSTRQALKRAQAIMGQSTSSIKLFVSPNEGAPNASSS